MMRLYERKTVFCVYRSKQYINFTGKMLGTNYKFLGFAALISFCRLTAPVSQRMSYDMFITATRLNYPV